MNSNGNDLSNVRIKITVETYKEARLQGLDSGTVCRIGSYARIGQPLDGQFLQGLRSKEKKEAAQRLWEQFREQVLAAEQAMRVAVTPRRSILEAPTLARATYRIAAI